MAGAVIDVENFTKKYGEEPAVSDLSFTAQSGKVTGFVGSNGAGKTTTLKALLGLIQATSGTATIEGKNYLDLSDPAITIGALIEENTFHPARTGRSHLRILARAAGLPSSRVDEVLKLVELEKAADRKVGGYSLGMKQRLSLATALLGDPRVLVLDEPSNGLDPQGIHWLRDLLKSYAKEGRTVLVSSHVLSELTQVADEIVIINGGKLIKQTTLAKLLKETKGATLEDIFIGLTDNHATRGNK
jgi:ABC-2 type transport system ATP-binding protein